MPHRLYLRMTVNERLQHATLVVSFVALVLTGFMLQFPDAWWVMHIRHHIGHLFEWRSAIHRVAGVILGAAGVWHFAYLALTRRGRQLFRDLLPACARPKPTPPASSGTTLGSRRPSRGSGASATSRRRSTGP